MTVTRRLGARKYYHEGLYSYGSDVECLRGMVWVQAGDEERSATLHVKQQATDNFSTSARITPQQAREIIRRLQAFVDDEGGKP